MRIPLATDYKTRTANPDKDARQKNSYIEVKNEQAIVRKRPSAQGGVSVGSGTAQGGYGTVLFYGDVAYPITSSTLTTCNNATNYVQGDHVTVDMVDYWANTSTVNTCPVGGVAGSDWSMSYVAAIGTLPTVYATFNSADKGVDIALSNGNLTATITNITTGANQLCRATIGKSSGKWYWEVTLDNVGDVNSTTVTGISNSTEDVNGNLGGSVNSWGHTYHNGGYACSGTAVKFHNNVFACFGINVASGNILSYALDMDLGTLTIYVNGSSQGIMYSGISGTIYPAMGSDVSTTVVTPLICTANFGSSAFSYSVPSGYNSGIYT